MVMGVGDVNALRLDWATDGRGSKGCEINIKIQELGCCINRLVAALPRKVIYGVMQFPMTFSFRSEV